VIEIINVSKKFRIWEDRSRDLKETTINFLRGKKRSFRDLWALQGINLKIKEGETVAFIGENGSGKSTLLKLLAGVYVPDEGKIATQGKISSLLELGVGFHPDLTGEENIYLNGAMLGFDSDDMRERFDEIVSFSEIGDFIYSPIRTYSSGMLMRLGFSVAMCVNPDILLIDEVLAVGDEAFQKKCLKRLEEFKSAGKTIVIVSHALELIRKFFGRVILLQEGKVIIDGAADRTIDKYHAILSNKERPRDLDEIVEIEKAYYAQTVSEISISEEKGESKKIKEKEEIEEKEEKEEREEKGEDEGKGPQKPKYERYGTFEAEIVDVALKNEKGEETNIFNSGERMSIFLKIRFHRDIEDPIIGFYIRKCEENHFLDIYGTNTRWQDIELGLIKTGEEMEVNFSHSLVVPEGTYYLLVAVADSEETKFYDWQENIRTFTVKSEDTSYTGIMNLNSQIFVNRFLKCES
jgi:ABC-type polysaccharide/polyol phosphate transport system ATPase subunit